MGSASSFPLPSIISYARAGALEHAWALFRAAGLESVNDDAAVVSVHGRLLKDRAIAAKGVQRRKLYLEAADAYARAGAISGELYPMINAATLSLLGGRRDRARTLARSILDRGQRLKNEPETPYWHAATRAEALLLLGEVREAGLQLKRAVARAPRAYEDHASTLRQFQLILDELGEDKAWLDAYRPPRSAHFAGHMTLSSRRGKVEQRIRAVIDEQRIGFGYGALAAGADIVIAEALLEKGAQLHLVLPASLAHFRKVSVARFGRDWARRFDNVLKKATAVRLVAGDCASVSPLAIRLATEVSMGSAVMHADALTSEAIQILILDQKAGESHPEGASGAAYATWRASGRRQFVIPAARVRKAGGESRNERTPHMRLAPMLRIDLSSGSPESVAAVLARLARVVKANAAIVPRWTGEEILVACSSVSEAARIGLSAADIMKTLPAPRIAGHYALVAHRNDPFGGGRYLSGEATRTVSEILRGTPPFAFHVSEDFAAVLFSGAPAGRPRVEYIGELPAGGPVERPARLYSLAR
jgi:hypothetical protein